ncbi:MAG: class I SAM-dependent methyltransferase [Flavobacteriales bacterium]|nr:class I SAM-dependent methyltransferase [Flavobacteriales bacterium]
MDRYQETFSTWNKVAARYQERFMYLDLYNASYDFFCGALSKNKARLLEIGCGPGNITQYLLTLHPDWDIFGIDIAPNMVELSRSNNPTARFAVMDSRQIADLNSLYDGIICGFCLPYLSYADSEKFIADCSHLLHENGVFYLSFVEGNPGKSGYQVGSTGDRIYFYYYETQSLTEQLQNNGFEILNLSKVNYSKNESESEEHILIIAKKR